MIIITIIQHAVVTLVSAPISRTTWRVLCVQPHRFFLIHVSSVCHNLQSFSGPNISAFLKISLLR